MQLFHQQLVSLRKHLPECDIYFGKLIQRIVGPPLRIGRRGILFARLPPNYVLITSPVQAQLPAGHKNGMINFCIFT